MCDYFKRLVVYCDGRRRIRSTPRKEDADGAHNQDPPPDGAVMSSELHFSFMIFVASANPCGISFSREVSESWSSTQPAWGTTPQMEAQGGPTPPDGAVMSSELHISFIDLLVKVAHNPLRKVEFRYIISNKMLSEKVKKFKYVLGNYVDS